MSWLNHAFTELNRLPAYKGTHERYVRCAEDSKQTPNPVARERVRVMKQIYIRKIESRVLRAYENESERPRKEIDIFVVH